MKGNRKDKSPEALEAELAEAQRRIRELESAEASRRQAERMRDEKRHLLFTLIDSIPDAIYFKDTHSRFTMINRALAKRFGLGHPSEAVGKTDSDFFTREHAQQAFDDEQKIIATQRPMVGKEEKETWADGADTWVSTTKMPLFNQDGKVVGTFGMSRDITAHKKAEAALAESENELRRHRDRLEELVRERTAELTEANERLQSEITQRQQVEKAQHWLSSRYEAILSAIPDIIMEVDLNKVYTWANAAGKEFFGNDVVGREAAHYFAGEQSTYQSVQSLFNGDENVVYIESWQRRRDGEPRLLAWWCRVLKDAEGRVTGALSTARDITDRRRMQEVQKETERLEAVSNLASGVAHSFGHITTAIEGFATAIAENVLPDTPAHTEAGRILDAAKHAANLTRQLMSVANADGAQGRTDLEPVSLARVITNSVQLVRPSVADGAVEILVRNPQKMPFVLADENQLLDVMVNLLLNAVEASPAGSRITIDTIERTVRHPRVNPSAGPGKYVGVRVKDTGEGMSKEVAARVFEPFFTTREQRSAFGLGLSVARNTMLAMNGWIDVRSKPGHGSTFRIFLLHGGAPAAAAAEAEVPAGLILLVDQREQDLADTAAGLTAAGLRVMTAANVSAGLTAFSKHADDISVTVVDLLMPGLGCRTLLEHVLKRDPGARIIVTSGFSRSYARHRLPMGAWSFLQKPFTGERLVETITELLRRG